MQFDQNRTIWSSNQIFYFNYIKSKLQLLLKSFSRNLSARLHVEGGKSEWVALVLSFHKTKSGNPPQLTVLNGRSSITPQIKQYTDRGFGEVNLFFLILSFKMARLFNLLCICNGFGTYKSVKIQNWGFEVLLDQPYIYFLEKFFSLPDTKVVSRFFI